MKIIELLCILNYKWTLMLPSTEWLIWSPVHREPEKWAQTLLIFSYKLAAWPSPTPRTCRTIDKSKHFVLTMLFQCWQKYPPLRNNDIVLKKTFCLFSFSINWKLCKFWAKISLGSTAAVLCLFQALSWTKDYKSKDQMPIMTKNYINLFMYELKTDLGCYLYIFVWFSSILVQAWPFWGLGSCLFCCSPVLSWTAVLVLGLNIREGKEIDIQSCQQRGQPALVGTELTTLNNNRWHNHSREHRTNIINMIIALNNGA